MQLNHGETATFSGAPLGTTLKFRDDADISPHILFGNVKFVEKQPVLPAIIQFRHAVSDVINIIARDMIP
jgi:hypothetical protein